MQEPYGQEEDQFSVGIAFLDLQAYPSSSSVFDDLLCSAMVSLPIELSYSRSYSTAVLCSATVLACESGGWSSK